MDDNKSLREEYVPNLGNLLMSQHSSQKVMHIILLVGLSNAQPKDFNGIEGDLNKTIEKI